MTPEHLGRLELELMFLAPREGADASALEDARAFNADVGDLRDALLEPARDLLARGGVSRELAACLERTVAELAFWRRVLVRLHGSALGDPPPSDYLVNYLLS